MTAIAHMLMLQASALVPSRSLGDELARAGIPIVNQERVRAFQREEVERHRNEASPFWRTCWPLARIVSQFARFSLTAVWEAPIVAILAAIGYWLVPPEAQVVFQATAKSAIQVAGSAFLFLCFMVALSALYPGTFRSIDMASAHWERRRFTAKLERLHRPPREMLFRIRAAERIPGTKVHIDVFRTDPFVWAVSGTEKECIGYFNTHFSE